MNKPNEKHTKEKNNITIHKILHKLLDAIKLFYEICKVLKENYFFDGLKKADARQHLLFVAIILSCIIRESLYLLYTIFIKMQYF